MENFEASVLSLTRIHLNNKQLQQFVQYRELLIEWNQKLNLTAIREPAAIDEKHFLDSLACSVSFDPMPKTVVDIGTGAGFPGIPLAIAFPELKVTLVESIQKKAHFCQQVVDTLGLKNVYVVAERAEVIGVLASYRNAFDLVVVRAVTKLPQLLEYARPLVNRGGSLLAMKGQSWQSEVSLIHEPYKTFFYSLPSDTEPRVLIKIPLS